MLRRLVEQSVEMSRESRKIRCCKSSPIRTYIYVRVGISVESPILGIPDEIPIYRNFFKWLFIWN